MRLAFTCAAPILAERRIRGPLGALMASAILLVGAVGPISAVSPAPAAKASPWSKAPTRALTKHHVASEKAAARLAVGSPRNGATKALPFRSVKVAHPATPRGASLQKSPTSSSVKPRIVAGPDVEVAQQFTGMTEHESGDFVPPDPWVGVNGTYVVQVVNSTARISNRLGTEISSVPTWALFALPAGQSASDARVMWDATHGRWVAISISFNGDFSSNYLNLAVSDGADPTAGWATFSFAYGAYLPDYPSVASSSDKVVVTDNLFDPTPNFIGADLVTVSWASIIGGTALTVNECVGPGYVHPRAAQVLSPSFDVHLIMESNNGVDSNQWYWRLRGPGTCFDVVDGTEFTGFAPFMFPPDPRQSPSDTIGTSNTAVDERPTDAVWQNNKLWWVSTFPWSYGGPANDAVALWTATTAPVTGAATPGVPQAIAPGDGIDAFMGGIGLTRNGTLVTIYSQSSSAGYVSMEANQIPPGGSLGTPVHLDDGDASYASERWGDFAGVAMDPVGTGSVWATHEVAAPDGTWRTDVVRLVADNDNPTLPGVPVALIAAPTALGASVPVRLVWPAATDVTSGNVHYTIAQSIDGSGFFEVSNVTGTSTVRQLLMNHTYQFAISAIDAVGHQGGWRYTTPLRPWLYQQGSAVFTGAWPTQFNSVFSGGSARYASVAGRYATFTATSARSIGFVTTKATTRGSFRVYVDGHLRATISAYSLVTRFRQLVFSYSWATPGTHKIRIVVLGTAHHPRVDVDAFVVLR
jgi:hypothetical protein